MVDQSRAGARLLAASVLVGVLAVTTVAAPASSGTASGATDGSGTWSDRVWGKVPEDGPGQIEGQIEGQIRGRSAGDQPSTLPARPKTLPSRLVARAPLGYMIAWSYAVNARGVGYAVWAEGNDRVRRIWAARVAPNGSWGRPRKLTGTFSRRGDHEFAGYPDVAVDQRGRAVVVWAQSRGSAMQVMSTTNRGKGRWGRPVALSAAGEQGAFPTVAVSGQGHAVVTWAGNFWFMSEGRFTVMATTRAPGGSWSAPVRLDADGDFYPDSRAPEPAVDNRGVATLTWPEISTDLSSRRLQVASFGAASGWQVATVATGMITAPRVATNPAGTLALAWTDWEGLLVQRRHPDGTWAPAERVVPLSGGVEAVNLEGVAISAAGQVAVSAERLPLQADRPTHRKFLSVQPAEGAPWQTGFASATLPAPGITPFIASLVTARQGSVTMTWQRQSRLIDEWPFVEVRQRRADGRWGKSHTVGRFASDAVLAVDGKGRVSMVYGEGGGRNRRDGGCCLTLRFARVPSR